MTTAFSDYHKSQYILLFGYINWQVDFNFFLQRLSESYEEGEIIHVEEDDSPASRRLSKVCCLALTLGMTFNTFISYFRQLCKWTQKLCSNY